jgi:diguanylate cyclase (GGDEF)-like protein
MIPTRLLLIEDNLGDARLIQEYLGGGDGKYVLDTSDTVADGVKKLRMRGYDVILANLSLPDSDGLLSVYMLTDAAPHTPIVVVTGNDDPTLAVMAVREGAQEYLLKDKINKPMLERVLQYSIERHGQLSQLKHMAYHDNLTNLANRAMFTHILEHDMFLASRNGYSLAVHFIDVDNFKGINDTYGHDVGDAFLKALATRLQSTVRVVDTVARFGGDEFVVLQNGVIDTYNVVTFANKLVSAFAEPLVCGSEKIKTAISVGVAVFPEHSDQAEQLITKADKALYQAKARGKGCFRCFTDD